MYLFVLIVGVVTCWQNDGSMIEWIEGQENVNVCLLNVALLTGKQ